MHKTQNCTVRSTLCPRHKPNFDSFYFDWCRYKFSNICFEYHYEREVKKTWIIFVVTDGVSISWAVNTSKLKMVGQKQLPLTNANIYIYIYVYIYIILVRVYGKFYGFAIFSFTFSQTLHSNSHKLFSFFFSIFINGWELFHL